MSESWTIKLPTKAPFTYEGVAEFKGGSLHLMETAPTDPPYARVYRAYAPQAWEWAERKPSNS